MSPCVRRCVRGASETAGYRMRNNNNSRNSCFARQMHQSPMRRSSRSACNRTLRPFSIKYLYGVRSPTATARPNLFRPNRQRNTHTHVRHAAAERAKKTCIRFNVLRSRRRQSRRRAYLQAVSAAVPPFAVRHWHCRQKEFAQFAGQLRLQTRRIRTQCTSGIIGVRFLIRITCK